MNDQVYQAIVSAIKELNEDWSYDVFNDVSLDTVLFGAESPIDSMGLVALVATIEQNVKDVCGVDLVLADDRAFSQKRSPFRTIRTLLDYTHELLSKGEVVS